MADHNIPGLNISQIRADILLAEKLSMSQEGNRQKWQSIFGVSQHIIFSRPLKN